MYDDYAPWSIKLQEPKRIVWIVQFRLKVAGVQSYDLFVCFPMDPCNTYGSGYHNSPPQKHFLSHQHHHHSMMTLSWPKPRGNRIFSKLVKRVCDVRTRYSTFVLRYSYLCRYNKSSRYIVVTVSSCPRCHKSRKTVATSAIVRCCCSCTCLHKGFSTLCLL